MGKVTSYTWLGPQPAELSDVTENYEVFRDLLWLLSSQPSRAEMWFENYELFRITCFDTQRSFLDAL